MEKRMIGSLLISAFTLGCCWQVPISQNMDAIASLSTEKAYAQEGTAPLSIASLRTVNGISLHDNAKLLHSKWGKPTKVFREKHGFDYTEVHRYSNKEVGFRDGYLAYVSISATNKTVVLNGQSIAIDRQEFEKRLGKPNWVNEDGITYQRGESVLKLFIDPTHKVISIDFYHIASV